MRSLRPGASAIAGDAFAIAGPAEPQSLGHRASGLPGPRVLVPMLVALLSWPGGDCRPSAFAGPLLRRPLKTNSKLPMVVAHTDRAVGDRRLPAKIYPQTERLQWCMLRRLPGIACRSGAVPRQMLAANAGKLMGDRDGLAGLGSDSAKVQLSTREIWAIMAPTDPGLRLRVVLSVVLLVLCRLANIMVPLTFKRAIDILTELQGGAAAMTAFTAAAPLLQAATGTVGMFLMWKLIQGLGEVVRQYMWVAVQSDLKRRVSEQLLGHLHNLSMRFHVTSKSGQTIQVSLPPKRILRTVCVCVCVLMNHIHDYTDHGQGHFGPRVPHGTLALSPLSSAMRRALGVRHLLRPRQAANRCHRWRHHPALCLAYLRHHQLAHQGALVPPSSLLPPPWCWLSRSSSLMLKRQG
jgi:hypothetical protein